MVNLEAVFSKECVLLRKQIEEVRYRLGPLQDEILVLEAKLSAYERAADYHRKGEG